MQVSLYDECEKLLECRLLKNDETVISGESLVFNGYLVDIGDQEGEKKPECDLNVDRRSRSFSRFTTPGLNSLIYIIFLVKHFMSLILFAAYVFVYEIVQNIQERMRRRTSDVCGVLSVRHKKLSEVSDLIFQVLASKTL